MKKDIKKLFCYIMVMSSLTGCTVQNSQDMPETEIAVDLTTEESVIEEKIVLETDLVDMTTLEMKNYIEVNMEIATELEMDDMVICYDRKLREEYNRIFEKFISPTYFQAINDTRDEQYVLHVEEIADEKIRVEVLEAIEMGYCFSMQEGAYYLVIDYKDFANNYDGYVSAELQTYYTIKKDEQLEPIRVEEYLNLSSEELYERAVKLESILKSKADFAFREDIKVLMGAYVDGLLSIDIFSGTIDYETGQLSQSTREVYNQIIKDNNTVLLPAIQELMAFLDTKDYILKFNDQDGNQEVLAMRHKYMTEIQSLIDTTYIVE